MEKNVLIVVAHRDDETFGCGGTIAKLIADNFKVYVISMTDGVSSREKSSSKEIETRYKNSLKAANIIGFKWLNKISGNFSDNAMDKEKFLDIVKLIEKAKKIVKPEMVITHYPEDLNIDHQIVSSATMTAFRPKTNEICKKIISFEIPSSTDYASYKKKLLSLIILLI